MLIAKSNLAEDSAIYYVWLPETESPRVRWLLYTLAPVARFSLVKLTQSLATVHVSYTTTSKVTLHPIY